MNTNEITRDVSATRPHLLSGLCLRKRMTRAETATISAKPARIITNGLSKANKPNINSATNASAKKIRVCTHTGCAAMRFKGLRNTYHPPPAPDGTFRGSIEQTRAYHTFSTQQRTTSVRGPASTPLPELSGCPGKLIDR